MKNSFGQSVCLTIFGESHGAAVGCVIDGLAPGIKVDEDFIARQLTRRRPSSALDTPRQEKDEFKIISGVFSDRTTGTPLTIVLKTVIFAVGRKIGMCRARRAVVIIPALEGIGISLATHIAKCAGVSDRKFGDLESDIKSLHEKSFPVLDDARGEEMAQRILKAREEADSVGGVTETVICGTPAGVGEPWFDSVESVISHAAFSLGGVKGVEFGAGFAAADMKGSECNDPLRVSGGRIVTTTNNNGGVNGGITNGMPIVFRCAVKPTPSIAQQQDTVDFIKNENTQLSIHGRHDPAIIRRICPVLDSVAALCVADMLSLRYGTDVLTKGVDDR